MSKYQDSAQAKPEITEKSQYENLMRKFSESHKEDCKTVAVDIPKVSRRIKRFPTGSQYEGTWDVLGMSGLGRYTFPNGVIYEGGFDDGMFDGEGELQYPSGEVIIGKFKHGNILERTLMFSDGLEYTENDWLYCQMPDRRYTLEYEKGVQPSGESYMTADLPPRKIPPGYYDSGDGFYDPITKMVYHVDDINSIVRSPSAREQKWIIENCRRSPCDEIGPRPDVYEDWLEPELEAIQEPLPAAVSRACMHLFREPSASDDLDMNESEDIIIGHWQDILDEPSDENCHRHHLRFQPTQEILHIASIFKKRAEEAEME